MHICVYIHSCVCLYVYSHIPHFATLQKKTALNKNSCKSHKTQAYSAKLLKKNKTKPCIHTILL